MCRPDGRHVFLKGKVQMITYLHINYPPAKGSGFPPTTNERILFMKIAQDFPKSWAILFTVLTVEFLKL